MRSRYALPLLCLAAALALGGCDSPSTGLIDPAHAASPARKFSLHKEPRSMPELTFKDSRGRTMHLTDLRGKVVLLNLWATWCAPCREEMPTLDRLQAQLGGRDFEVVALSVDHTGLDVVRRFFQSIGVERLRLYIDQESQSLDKLNIFGLPATLLIDDKGRELGRLLGAAQWDSPEMLRLFREVIARKESASRPTTVRLLGTAMID